MRDEQLLILNDYLPRVVEVVWGGGAVQTCAGRSSASRRRAGTELEDNILAHVTTKADFRSFYKTFVAFF